MTERSLIFVYNADSGILNALKDYVHKLVKPSTYPCSLCAVTFGNRGMKREWREFIDSLGIPVKFLHRDEFFDKYSQEDASYPSAYLKEGKMLTLFITTDEMNAVKSLDEMITLVEKKVKSQKILT